MLSQNATDITANTNVPNTSTGRPSPTASTSAGRQELAIYVRQGGWNINWWQLTRQ
ncbi:carbohydrate-binding protein [Cellvibrio japonicus]|uniref:Carbohydrate binding protein, putative, cbp6C n=1 Tax=Cellvibrio japonicus (strain Ueda107) TaxID=498211 RepID=B3PEJ8_CELJU|nr:carbohydrate-binding protein [Cellvibrio japonicus]ACE84883.1 carbohydrate binding protein, putative, cbp6C [Cellvibrio japonicus Ueda107]